MQITENSTGMVAGLAVAADKEARDFCIVVVKGTFRTDAKGRMTPAEEQRPLVYADEHHGDPGTSCIEYECDFALTKQRTDVLVAGKAVAPSGQPVTKLVVGLEVQGHTKEVVVIGPRSWVRFLGSVFPSDAAPFTEMPLTYDRAFGGQDDSRGPGKRGVERRNPVGRGFHPHRPGREVEGSLLPNLYRPQQRLKSLRDKVDPVGFGCVGRGWKPRIDYAGTYDQQWLDEICPFLPADFDERYFQSAPEDQQFPLFRGGEVIRCLNMATNPVVQYTLPTLKVPVRFRFADREVEQEGALDTVILEPHLGLATLVWRARVALSKKLHALQSIAIGERRRSKPHFARLSDAVAWLRQLRGGES